MNSRYSSVLKESIIKKISTPGGPAIMQISRELNIHHVTIRSWVKTYANIGGMKDSNNWTPEEKLAAIIKAASMNENELGEFLRANGLHSTDLEKWKEDFCSSQRPGGRPKLDPELVQLRTEKKALVSDLKRKDKALAEMSARIILIKKVTSCSECPRKTSSCRRKTKYTENYSGGCKQLLKACHRL